MADWDVLFDVEEDRRGGAFADDGEIEDVECIKETAKALLVKIGGTNVQRWVPKKGLRVSSDIQRPGDTGTLRVQGWLIKLWDQEDPLEQEQAAMPFKVEGCIVMQQSAKALLIKMPDGKETWFPLTQIDAASECLVDGDSGTLLVSDWIAKQKGLTE